MSAESLHKDAGDWPSREEVARRSLKMQPKIPTINDIIGPGGITEVAAPSKIPAKLKLATARNDHMDAGGRPINIGPFERREIPDPPAFLKYDEHTEALAEWNRVAPMLQTINLMKPEDRAAFTSYCIAWERLVNSDTQGEWLAASRELRSWCKEFGFTPSSESNLASPSQDEDPFN